MMRRLLERSVVKLQIALAGIMSLCLALIMVENLLPMPAKVLFTGTIVLGMISLHLVLSREADKILDSVLLPMGSIRQCAMGFANGDLDARVAYDEKNELGDMANAVNHMAAVMSALIADVGTAAEEVRAGDFSVRCNASLYGGTLGKMINEYNETTDALSAYLVMMSGRLESISKGQLPDLIFREYAGEYGKMTDSINRFIIEMGSLNRELDELVNAVSSGNLDARADLNRHSGSFAAILGKVNDLLDSVLYCPAAKPSQVSPKELSADAADMSQVSERFAADGRENSQMSTVLYAMVEAARAGVHGKGFAAVADEARNIVPEVS